MGSMPPPKERRGVEGPIGKFSMRLYHDLVEFVRAWCVLWRLQWGARRQRKSTEVLNDPKGISGADFDQIPVSIIFDVVVRTAFLFCEQVHLAPVFSLPTRKKKEQQPITPA